MAGFAAAIGGGGNAAAQYGQQVRGILEQRRGDIANMIATHVLPELGQEDRNGMIPLIADLHSGAPLGKTLEGVTKILQSHQKDKEALANAHANLAQVVGPQPAAPPSEKGPGARPLSPPAAQPSASPVQPSQQQPQNFTPMIGMSQASPQQQAAPPPQQAPAPQQQPIQPPQEQDPLTAVRAKRDEIVNRFNTLMSSGAPNMRRFYEAEMQGELQNLAPFEQQAMRLHSLAGLRAAPEYQKVPDFMKVSPVEQAYGFQPSSMMGMASLMGVHQVPIDVTDMSPERKAALGLPPTAIGPQLINEDRLGNMGQAVGAKYVPPVTAQTPGGMGEFSRTTGSKLADLQGAVPPSQNANIKAPTVGGGVELTSPAQMKAGTQPMQVPGAVTPAMLPTTTTQSGLRSIQTTDAQGNPVTRLEPVSTSSTRTKGGAVAAPGATPPAGAGGPATPLPTVPKTSGAREFEKPLTPQQIITNQQQLNTLTRAEVVMQNIRNNSHLMDSMIESGKLKLEAGEGGLLRAVVAKNMPMTPAEANFVGDFNTMAEDINLLRKPLGGAGFRSTEAWVALQGLKGSLLSHPDVSRRVMDNTLQAFQALREPLAKGLHQQTPAAGGGAAAPTHRYNPTTGKIEEIKQ